MMNPELRRKGWHKKWSRLTAMSWDEIRVRLSQEFSKRFDLLLFRAGLGTRQAPSMPRRSVPAPSFFGAENFKAVQRADLLREYLPQEADRIVGQADSVLSHEFQLLGYEKVDYGRDIDWHSDAVHRKRSPLKPWFKIDFLNFHEVGDHKIIWELNRHQHLVTLAKAWCLTGNRCYADEVVAQWYSWQKANPYPLGINWASALEVAFRGLSWLWVGKLLAECGDLPATFEADLLASVRLHGQYIERYLSTYFSPNTHLIGEAVGLFFIGTLYPEIPRAKRWQDKGWRILTQEALQQVRPDGVYFEQALYYHVYALDFFLHSRLLACATGREVPKDFDDVLKKMLDVVDALSALGPIPGFGDDDGGRVFDPQRNQVDCMTDPLIIGSVFYKRTYAASTLTEEAIWLLGDKAIEKTELFPNKAVDSRAFELGGIYLINDDQPCRTQMMIDAGPQGTGHSGHGHADALSLRLSMEGRRFLVDPGTFCYISNDENRNRFRGTRAHNTLTVDGFDQAVPLGPFAWDSIPRVKAETWVAGQTFDFFVGSHDGYRRLSDPVLHRRFVFHVRGGVFVVRDVAEGSGTHLLEVWWHFAPAMALTKERTGFVCARTGDKESADTKLALLFDANSEWNTEICEGFVSPAYGARQPGPILRMSANARLPEDCAVLLMPFAEHTNTGRFTAIEKTAESCVRGYRYQQDPSTEFLFFAGKDKSVWSSALWSSDSEFLYIRMQATRLAHVVMIGGSFAKYAGRRFASQSAVSEIFEWKERSAPGAEDIASIPDIQAIDFDFVDPMRKLSQ